MISYAITEFKPLVNYYADGYGEGYNVTDCYPSFTNVGDYNGDNIDDFIILDCSIKNVETYPYDLILDTMYLIYGGNQISGEYKLNELPNYLHSNRFGFLPYIALPGSITHGDINNDGYSDLLFTYHNASNYTNIGIILGSKQPWNSHSIGDELDGVITDISGTISYPLLDATTDINGDNFDDIFITGQVHNEKNMTIMPIAYILLNDKDNTIENRSIQSADIMFYSKDEHSGASLHGMGDLNGDGLSDFTIDTCPITNSITCNSYLFFGRENWNATYDINDADVILYPSEQYDVTSTQRIDDINGDGYNDIFIISGPNYSNQREKYSILFGHPNEWMKKINVSLIDTTFNDEGNPDINWDMSEAGDVNGDAIQDFLISIIREENYSICDLDTYLILGNVSWDNQNNLSEYRFNITDINDTKYINFPPPFTHISGGGDYTGDGLDDFLVFRVNETNTAFRIFLIAPYTNIRPLNIMNISIFLDPAYQQKSEITTPGSKLYIELRATDRDPASPNIETVRMNSSFSDIGGFQVDLKETGNNSGIFRSVIDTSRYSQEPTSISAHPGEFVIVTSTQDPDVNDKIYIYGKPEIIPDNATYYAMEDEPFSLNFTIYNSTGGNWGLTKDADWLQWVSMNTSLYGTPNDGDVGTYDLSITYSHPLAGEAVVNFTITVENAPPVILTTPNITAQEDSPYSTDLDSDDDPNGTTWALLSNIPWLLLNGTTGLLEGTPNNSMVGQWPANVSVSDTHGGTSWLNFTINITNVNDPPEWLDVPSDQIIHINDTLISDVNATDLDIGDIITYRISNSTAPNITINGTTGVIDWLAFPIGNYSVTINASDGNVTISHSFNITVYDPTPPPPPNHPPFLEPVGNLRAMVGRVFSLQLNGSDPDPWDALNLTYILDKGPAGLSLDPHTGSVSWTPTEADIGDHTVIITLTDGKASVNTTYVITVEKPPGTAEVTAVNTLLPIILIFVSLIVYGVVITRKLMGERDRPGKKRK